MKEAEKNKERIINILLILTGIVCALLRMFYVYYTPSWRRQHDVIGFGADEGQAAFIEYFHQTYILLDAIVIAQCERFRGAVRETHIYT